VYEKQILLSLVNSTVQDTSIKEDIGYEAIMGIIDRSIERDSNWEDVTNLEVIGLDEISLKKGHRDFVAIITGRMETETVILGVLPDRKKATVKAFLSGIPQRVRQTIHSVCTDMYEGFVHAAKEVFGKRVKIVMDRFHVAKRYRSGLDSLRKSEGCGSYTATPQTLVFQPPIAPCLVISLFLQKAAAMVVEPWASLRI